MGSKGPTGLHGPITSTGACFAGRYSPTYRSPEPMARRCMPNPSVSWSDQLLILLTLEFCTARGADSGPQEKANRTRIKKWLPNIILLPRLFLELLLLYYPIKYDFPIKNTIIFATFHDFKACRLQFCVKKLWIMNQNKLTEQSIFLQNRKLISCTNK